MTQLSGGELCLIYTASDILQTTVNVLELGVNVMGIESAKTGKLLYHLTELDNLDSIIKYGLLPRKVILEHSIKFNDVADENIIDKRMELGLGGYTPFHFHPYSAFDVAVKNTHNAQKMIYICIDRELARQNGFRVLPRHPLSGDKFKLYDYDEGFDLIDWDTLTKVGRNDTYAKEVKMAECLTDLIVPPKCFKCIYVPSEDVKQIVEKRFEKHNIDFPPPYINVMKQWFVY